jgi:hypothetical protein
MGQAVIGIEASAPGDAAEPIRRVYGVEHSRRFGYGPRGGRNRHLMSGRIG